MFPRLNARGAYMHLPPLPATGPPQFVTINILRPLPKILSGHQMETITTDRYKMLTSTIPIVRMSLTHVQNIFLDHSSLPHGALSYGLADNGPQVVSKSLMKFCPILELKHLSATAYHLKPDRQVERYSWFLISLLYHYALEYCKDGTFTYGSISMHKTHCSIE